MEFNPILAKELASLINCAYKQHHINEQWIPIGYTILQSITIKENGSTIPFGYICTKNNQTYVIFRGTSTPFEWYTDVLAAQVPFIVGKTTKGFKGIYDQIIPQIPKLPNNTIISGHSMGGALAHLLGYTFKEINPIIYSFCVPRFCDIELACSYNSLQLVSYRIFNTEDIVSYLPLATTNIGLEHIPIEILAKFFTKSNSNSFQHVGVPIPVTYNRECIMENHSVLPYIDQVKY